MKNSPVTSSTPPEGSTLSNRQLNRSFLARQLLVERRHRSAASVIEHLVGMQSQVPRDPFVGLWSRIDEFDHAELDQLMLDRKTVRMTLMRGTIHLVTNRDAYLLRPAMQAMIEKLLAGNAIVFPNLDGLDLDAVVASARAMLEREPMTGKHLGLRLGEAWPDRDPTALSYVPRYVLPLVQVTPRGVWGKSQQPALTTIEAWLGEPMDRYHDPDDVIVRYLAAFGPATVTDIQVWSGLSGLREPVERLRPDLVTYRDERNRELLDVPDAPFPDPETPVPVRFLPGFENALLSHADRTRIITDEHRKRMWKVNGPVAPSFLVDGYVAGTWKLTKTKSEAVLDITPFDAPLPPSTRAELETEGRRLLAFLAPDAGRHDVIFRDSVDA
ncbi:MAG: winged helix DNA-binding domain-containing protein [Chloroflexota bacterium]|nr:winged helix DNA-binding domain-containing protein [Chloroflexota bacterium]